MDKYSVIEGLNKLESHFLAARAATAYFFREIEANRAEVSPGFRPRDVRDCHDDLENTYFVRLFTEFEVTLRDFWENELSKTTRPKARDLLDSFGSRLTVREEVREQAHAVRQRRNSIIHGGNAVAVTVAEAKKYLCMFITYFPDP